MLYRDGLEIPIQEHIERNQLYVAPVELVNSRLCNIRDLNLLNELGQFLKCSLIYNEPVILVARAGTLAS